MRKEFEGKITVYRILDSRREKFNLSKAYEDKVDVKNVITAPEIEKFTAVLKNSNTDVVIISPYRFTMQRL